MFRAMRRNRQQLSPEDTRAVLERGTHGVLACAGDDGYPYAVPLSYVYFEDRIYFHAAQTGHKLDAIAREPRVSFCVVDQDSVVSAEYTTYFRSAIAFGRARMVEGHERMRAFEALAARYSGDQPEALRREKVAGCTRAAIVAIDIEHLTGKEAAELVAGRG